MNGGLEKKEFFVMLPYGMMQSPVGMVVSSAGGEDGGGGDDKSGGEGGGGVGGLGGSTRDGGRLRGS